MPGLRRLSLAIGAVVLAAVLVEVAWLGRALWRGRALIAESQPFEQRHAEARHRLLVIGDSTAVGTGAARPALSVAGRLAAALPDLAVVNRARDGAVTADLVEQLDGARDLPVDAVLIQVGGNDILQLTGLDRLRGDVQRLLRQARERADTVVMLSTGDVGTAPAFLFPLDRWLSWRTRLVRAVFMEVAAEAGIEYVDLYEAPGASPFRQHPAIYYAADGLHPSGEGYRLWYERLLERSSLARTLGGAHAPRP